MIRIELIPGDTNSLVGAIESLLSCGIEIPRQQEGGFQIPYAAQLQASWVAINGFAALVHDTGMVS